MRPLCLRLAGGLAVLEYSLTQACCPEAARHPFDYTVHSHHLSAAMVLAQYAYLYRDITIDRTDAGNKDSPNTNKSSTDLLADLHHDMLM